MSVTPTAPAPVLASRWTSGLPAAALSVLSLLSLAFPLVTPLIAVPAVVLCALRVRSGRTTAFTVALVVCSAALAASLVLDLTLFAAGTQLDTPRPAATLINP